MKLIQRQFLKHKGSELPTDIIPNISITQLKGGIRQIAHNKNYKEEQGPRL